MYQRKSKLPWEKTYSYIKARCDCKSGHYFRNGVKNFITVDDLKYLWFRDKAYEMESPSIDRINTSENYERHNCRYVEIRENRRRKKMPPLHWQQSRENDKCTICKTAKYKHKGRGICSKCYAKKTHREHIEKSNMCDGFTLSGSRCSNRGRNESLDGRFYCKMHINNSR